MITRPDKRKLKRSKIARLDFVEPNNTLAAGTYTQDIMGIQSNYDDFTTNPDGTFWVVGILIAAAALVCCLPPILVCWCTRSEDECIEDVVAKSKRKVKAAIKRGKDSELPAAHTGNYIGTFSSNENKEGKRELEILLDLDAHKDHLSIDGAGVEKPQNIIWRVGEGRMAPNGLFYVLLYSQDPKSGLVLFGTMDFATKRMEGSFCMESLNPEETSKTSEAGTFVLEQASGIPSEEP